MNQLGITEIPNAQIKQTRHRFGDSADETKTVCAILFPFEYKAKDKSHTSFQIHFDVIPGTLPFLVGWPSLRAMKANINCEYLNMGIKVDGKYSRIPLKDRKHHAFLPFRSGIKSQYRSHYKPAMYSPTCELKMCIAQATLKLAKTRSTVFTLRRTIPISNLHMLCPIRNRKPMTNSAQKTLRNCTWHLNTVRLRQWKIG